MKAILPIVALTLLAACSGSSSSSTSTGGSCLGEAQTCTGAIPCCTGLACSPAAGLCLTEQGSNGPGSSTSSASTATTTSTTGAHGTSSSGTTGSHGTTVSATSGSSGTTHGTTASATSGTSHGTTSSTASSTTSSTGGAASGTTSGSTTGGYAGGCTAAAYYTTELQLCPTTTCTCGQTCVTDTVLTGGDDCESTCTTSADCPDPVTFCSGGICVLNTCTSEYNVCGVASPSAGDGFCLPYDYGTGSALDLCALNGTAPSNGACSGPFQFSSTVAFGVPASDNCSERLVCDVTSNTCVEACDPTGGTAICPGSCVATDTTGTVTTIGECE